MNNHVSNNVLTKKHSSLSIRSSSSSSSSSGSSTFDGVAISCRRTTAAATGHHHVQTEVLEMKYFVPVQLWIAHPERTICYVCARHFSAFRRKHTCRMCGEVICKRCSVFKRVHVHVGENTVRVCSGCLVLYRKGQVSPHCSFQNDQDNDSPHVIHHHPVRLIDIEIERQLVRGTNHHHDHHERTQALEATVKVSHARIIQLEMLVKRISTPVQEKGRSQSEHRGELQAARDAIAQLQSQLQQSQVSYGKEPSSSGQSPDDRNDDPKVEEASEDSSSSSTQALRRKLLKMERQLQQAGLNVVQDIPYDEAKAKVHEISSRMQEIGSSEITCADKTRQAALRKEYFTLERDMEKYNTALVLTDEYIQEQQALEDRWHAGHEGENHQALCRLRQILPVNLAILTEQDLITRHDFSTTLARKLKQRTNVLELLRVHPAEIQRMHPSILESYRVTNLSILERRAIHAVLYPIMNRVWKPQRQESLASRKYDWGLRLWKKLQSMIDTLERHVVAGRKMSEFIDESASCECPSPHRCCPVRMEEKLNRVYVDHEDNVHHHHHHHPTTGDNVYFERHVMKGDPEQAGAKALAEAQAQMKKKNDDDDDCRQPHHCNHHNPHENPTRTLRAHYGMQRVTDISRAVKVMDELECFIEDMHTLETKWALWTVGSSSSSSHDPLLVRDYTRFLEQVQERVSCSLASDDESRAPCEIQLQLETLAYALGVVQDMKRRVGENKMKTIPEPLLRLIESSERSLQVLQQKIHDRCSSSSRSSLEPQSSSPKLCRRPTWSTRIANAQQQPQEAAVVLHDDDVDIPPASIPESTLSTGKTVTIVSSSPPMDMLAAIRARKKKKNPPPLSRPTGPPSAGFPHKNTHNALLEAIKKRAHQSSVPVSNVAA